MERHARVELLDGQAVLLGDPLDRALDLFVGRLRLAVLDHLLDQARLDQPLERVGAQLGDLLLGRAGAAHRLLLGPHRAEHLGNQHDLPVDLCGDAVDERRVAGSGARGFGARGFGSRARAGSTTARARTIHRPIGARSGA